MRVLGAAGALLLASLSAFGSASSKIHRGVNLGGWLVSEPWMTPSLYTSTDTDCEWDLCNALGKKKCKETLEAHWSTFYTRDDFEQIKGAGLTGVRIPFGYWAVTLLDYEPYVDGQYPYLIRAVNWANELGLDVFIDIHGAVGSQNGWEESGLIGGIEFPDNTTNTDRTLLVLRNLTEEFSKEQYGGVVTNIELLNEPLLTYDDLTAFYTLGANVVGAANVTTSNSTQINTTISDAFLDPHTWENYNPWDADASSPAPYITVDTHQFWGFTPENELGKLAVLESVCEFGKAELSKAAAAAGTPPTLVGEWSLDTGVTANSTTTTAYDQEKRTWFRTLFEAQNAAFTPHGAGEASIGWYFWAWKTEYYIDAWSYSKGVAEQYIPSNVSDPSTYAYPIRADGCIDTSHNYTAPATVPNANTPAQTASSSASSASATASGSSSASAAASSATTSSSKKSAASSSAVEVGTLGMALLSVVSMTFFWAL